jgi:hypothetical protein
MDEKQLLLEAWKTTIASQSHFNEMGMKLRSFALTLVAAILTAEGVANAGGLAILAALVSWVAFYLLDRWYYFYLLLGAVRHGEALEDRARELGMALPGVVDSAESLLGLTHRVSRLNQEGWKWLGKYKLDLYYLLIGVAILMILCLRAVD